MEGDQFISWPKAQNKFGLLNIEERDWDIITGEIVHEQLDIIGRDKESVIHGLWIGVFTNHSSDLVVVFENEASFDP